MSTRGADATAGASATIVEVKEATPTEYVVLKMGSSKTEWTVVAAGIRASSAEAAIKAVDSRPADPAANASIAKGYVAVPVRSWQPVKPKTTTKTITTLEAL